MLKYQQLQRTLSQELAALPDHEALPPIRHLMAQYDVSLSTVNRALNELEQQGLLERHQGRGLFPAGRHPKPDQGTLGVVLPGMDTVTYIRLLEGIEHSLAQRQQIMVFRSDPKRADNLSSLANANIGNLIVAPTSWDTADLNYIKAIQSAQQRGCHITTVELPLPGVNADFVAIDATRAFEEGTNALLKLGCRKLGFVCRSNSKIYPPRLLGTQRAVDRANAELAILDTLNFSNRQAILDEAGAQAIDGLVVGQTELSIPLHYQYVLERRQNWPQHLAVAGVVEKGERLLGPQTVTIEKPSTELGRHAAEVATRKDKEGPAVVEFLNATIHVGY